MRWLRLSSFLPYNTTLDHETIIAITLVLAAVGVVVLYAVVRNP